MNPFSSHGPVIVSSAGGGPFQSGGPIGVSDSNSGYVSYTSEQAATSAQQAQARTNIGYVDVRSPLFAGGAKGDGATDDSAAFNAAIAYCKANNVKKIQVPEGAYTVANVDFSDTIGLTIEGVARDSTNVNAGGSRIVLRDPSKNSFYGVGSGSNTFHGLTIKNLIFVAGQRSMAWNYTANQGFGAAGNFIYMQDTRGLLIENCALYYAPYRCISLDSVVAGGAMIGNIEWCIRDCFVYGGAKDCVYLGSASDGRMSGCYISHGGMDNWWMHTTNGSTRDYAVGSNVTMAGGNNIIVMNQIYQAVGYNVYITGEGHTFALNRVDGSSRECIYLSDCTLVKVDNNWVFDAGVYRQINSNGIILGDGYESVDSGTAFSSYSGFSYKKKCQITLSATAFDNVISNNTVAGLEKCCGFEDYSDVSQFGIIDSGINNKIHNNTVNSHYSAGIYFSGKGSEATDNKLSCNVLHAIWIDSGAIGINVHNNRLILNGEGIFDTGTNSVITGNKSIEQLVSLSTTTSAIARGYYNTIQLTSVTGLAIGDTIAVQMNTGIYIPMTIKAIDGNTVTINNHIPGKPSEIVIFTGRAVKTRMSAYGLRSSNAVNQLTANNIFARNSTANVSSSGSTTMAVTKDASTGDISY